MKYFFLKVDGNGALSLRKSHAYYTQVQLQMVVTGHQWVDFVVFFVLEEDDDGKEQFNLFVQRVPFASLLYPFHVSQCNFSS